MSEVKLWQLLGGPGSVPYHLFDVVRKRVNRKLAAYLVAKASPQGRRCHVLEAGSGPAFASSLLASRPGVFSVALDIDVDALREARKRDPALPVVIGDLYSLPFKMGLFDLVWNSSTLEHLAAPDRALAEMTRVAGQKGYIFVGVPYRGGPLGFQPWIKDHRLGVWIGAVFSRGELIGQIQQARLEPVETICYFFRFFIGVLARKP